MFRLAIISFITLRVTLCPLFCADDLGVGMPSEAVVANDCGCPSAVLSGCDKIPRPGDQSPGCPDGGSCDCSCVCHATRGVSERMAVSDVDGSFDRFSLDTTTTDLGKLVVVPAHRHAQRLDLINGRSIRLAFSSLLI